MTRILVGRRYVKPFEYGQWEKVFTLGKSGVGSCHQRLDRRITLCTLRENFLSVGVGYG